MNEQDNPLIESIEFIFSECERIMKMQRDAFKHLPMEDILSSLPHPSGRGRMRCGRAAAACVTELAKEAGRRSGLLRRVSLQTLRGPTEELLVQRPIVEKRDLNRKQVDRFLASVGRKARMSCGDIVHFVPCALMTAQDPEVLVVGPVIFHNKANFRRRLLSHLKGYGRNQKDEAHREHARWLMAAAARFYRQFDRVAEVTVHDCDPETSGRQPNKLLHPH